MTASHGGDLHHIRRHYPNVTIPWIDLSTGINPNGYPWFTRISADRLLDAGNRLPGTADYDRCRTAYARYLGCDPARLLFDAGTQGLIEKIPTLFPRTAVYILGPTYSEHGRAWARAGHEVHPLPYDETSLARVPPGRLLVITSPNNPDGKMIAPDPLYRFICDYGESGGAVVVDEAYMDLTPGHSLLNRPLPDNVYLLRSLGKFFGLAGLRLGLLHAAAEVCARLAPLSPLWNISTLSLTIAAHAVADETWITATRRDLARKMEDLCALLAAAGYPVAGATDLFCLVRGADMAALHRRLAQAGIYVRAFPDRPGELRFGLPPTDAAFTRLQQALHKD